MNLPPINTLKAFITVVEQGRFNRAAEVLSLTESAVSHQIRKLESFLGIRLMERGRNGLELTSAGKTFYRSASDALSRLESGIAEISEQPEHLSITLPPSLAALWLAPSLWQFYDTHTDSEVSILPSLRLCDLNKESIDLGIRLASKPDWPDCRWLGLWEEYCFPVATPALAEALQSQGWDALKEPLWLIHNKLHPTEWQDWSRAFGIPVPETRHHRTFASFDYAINAALSGQGIAMARTPMVNGLLRDNRLQAPFGEQFRLKTGKRYFATWPDTQHPLRDRFLTWLETQVEMDHTAP